MTDLVFNFKPMWKDINIQTGARASTFAKYIRSMCQGEIELEEKYKDVIRSISWGVYMGNFNYWYTWRSYHDNKDMWPKFGVNEATKKNLAKEILKRFCPIASEFWIRKALANEEKIRMKSYKRTDQLNIALNNI